MYLSPWAKTGGGSPPPTLRRAVSRVVRVSSALSMSLVLGSVLADHRRHRLFGEPAEGFVRVGIAQVGRGFFFFVFFFAAAPTGGRAHGHAVGTPGAGGASVRCAGQAFFGE